MDASKQPVLDEFGKLLMERVRDDACAYLGRLFSGKMADASSKKIYEEIKKLGKDDRDIVARLLVKAVDAGIVRFLHFLDENEVEVLFGANDGKRYDIRAISDGLAGELHTDKGWVAKYSKFSDRI